MKQYLLIFAIVLMLILPAGCVSDNTPVSANAGKGFGGIVIALDPGHGGADHGAISAGGIKEDQLNLQVSLLVKEKLEQAGAIVVMTRKSADLDYSGEGSTRKKKDMDTRARFIRASNASAVISIHMNKYPNKKYYGPQIYFLKDSAEGKKLAGKIQDQLLAAVPSYKKFRIVEGDYFILHVVNTPTVLVECGFLSNDADAKRLNDSAHQQKIAECIYKGICDYFEVQYE